jgi:hypothetical protein
LDLALGFRQEISSKLLILEICNSDNIKNMMNYSPVFVKKSNDRGQVEKKLVPVPKPNRRKSKKSSPEIRRTN